MPPPPMSRRKSENKHSEENEDMGEPPTSQSNPEGSEDRNFAPGCNVYAPIFHPETMENSNDDEETITANSSDDDVFLDDDEFGPAEAPRPIRYLENDVGVGMDVEGAPSTSRSFGLEPSSPKRPRLQHTEYVKDELESMQYQSETTTAAAFYEELEQHHVQTPPTFPARPLPQTVNRHPTNPFLSLYSTLPPGHNNATLASHSPMSSTDNAPTMPSHVYHNPQLASEQQVQQSEFHRPWADGPYVMANEANAFSDPSRAYQQTYSSIPRQEFASCVSVTSVCQTWSDAALQDHNYSYTGPPSFDMDTDALAASRLAAALRRNAHDYRVTGMSASQSVVNPSRFTPQNAALAYSRPGSSGTFPSRRFDAGSPANPNSQQARTMTVQMYRTYRFSVRQSLTGQAVSNVESNHSNPHRASVQSMMYAPPPPGASSPALAMDLGRAFGSIPIIGTQGALNLSSIFDGFSDSFNQMADALSRDMQRFPEGAYWFHYHSQRMSREE